MKTKKAIFEEVRAGGLRMRNRLVRSATWLGLAAPDGSLPEEVFDVYRELAEGGVGAVVSGFASVMDGDRWFGGMARLSRDGLVPQWRRLAETVHAGGAPLLAQLALGGFFPPDGRGEAVEPDDLSEADLALVVRRFAEAARRAAEAGLDGVQLHAAHFFFLSRFASPAANHRTDGWGGSTAGRARLLREILAAVRAAAPGLAVWAKVNGCDYMPGGLEEEESIALCRLLAEDGIDAIEASGNGTSVAGVRAGCGEAYFLPFAARLAREVPVPVILVGGLRSREAMQGVLDGTDVELLSLSRPLLCEPDWPERLRRGESDASRCVSCNRCYSTPGHRCAFRPREEGAR